MCVALNKTSEDLVRRYKTYRTIRSKVVYYIKFETFIQQTRKILFVFIFIVISTAYYSMIIVFYNKRRISNKWLI